MQYIPFNRSIRAEFIIVTVVNVANSLPEETRCKLAKPADIPRGDPAQDSSHPEVHHLISYKTEKAKRILDLGEGEGSTPYRSMIEATQGMVEVFAERGW